MCASAVQLVRGEGGDFPFFVDEFAALHGEVHQVGAEAISEIAVVAGVEDQQIGGLAGFERTYCFGASQRVSAVDGGRGNGLFDGHAQASAGQRDHCLHIERSGVVRIEVAAERDGHAGIDQCACGSVATIAVEARAGQKRGDHTGFGDLTTVACGGVFQMIDGRHMVAFGEPDGGGEAGTVGMNLAFEAELAGRLQIAIERGQHGGVAIPNKIGEAGYPTTADLGKQVGDDPVDGLGVPSFGFARQPEQKAGDEVEGIAAERPEHA